MTYTERLQLPISSGLSFGVHQREDRAPSPPISEEPVRLRAGRPVILNVELFPVRKPADCPPRHVQLQTLRRSLGYAIGGEQRQSWGRVSSSPLSIFPARNPTIGVILAMRMLGYSLHPSRN